MENWKSDGRLDFFVVHDIGRVHHVAYALVRS